MAQSQQGESTTFLALLKIFFNLQGQEKLVSKSAVSHDINHCLANVFNFVHLANHIDHCQVPVVKLDCILLEVYIVAGALPDSPPGDLDSPKTPGHHLCCSKFFVWWILHCFFTANGGSCTSHIERLSKG